MIGKNSVFRFENETVFQIITLVRIETTKISWPLIHNFGVSEACGAAAPFPEAGEAGALPRGAAGGIPNKPNAT